ncbi:Alpha-latroinsectotoxin-Lt1a-like protein [Aphelenchoides bicaudatus]|nr:Alpha-latroinsectotoxin-Lt1a-like protein [Aphelenchoides bicaudatus]
MVSIRLILLFLIVKTVTGESVAFDSINQTLSNFNQETFDQLISKIGTNWTDNEYQHTLLHLAARNGYYSTAKALINKDPSLINATDKDNWYPIHYGAFKGHCDIISLLLENGADVNSLAKFDDDPNSPSVSPLYLAARKGHVGCVRVLLDNGANINHQTSEGESAIHIASKEGHYDVVKLLVERGADTNIKDNDNDTALDLAIKSDNRNYELINYLDENIKYPVHSAVSNNLTTKLNELIAANFDAYTFNEHQETPLRIAARKGYYQIAKLLINKDPRLVNATDKHHWFPLHYAAFEGHCGIISLLLDNGADVNSLAKFNDDSNSPSVSPLYLAALNGSVECVRILLDNGADINHQTSEGESAIHVASKEGYYEIVKVLIENGADVNIKNNDNKTALDVAKNKEIIDYLEGKSSQSTPSS